MQCNGKDNALHQHMQCIALGNGRHCIKLHEGMQACTITKAPIMGKPGTGEPVPGRLVTYRKMNGRQGLYGVGRLHGRPVPKYLCFSHHIHAQSGMRHFGRFPFFTLRYRHSGVSCFPSPQTGGTDMQRRFFFG